MKDFLNIFCKGLAVAALFELSGELMAQDIAPNKEVVHSTLFGVGTAKVLDTYLSPYQYEGMDMRVQRETMRMTNLWSGKVSNHTMVDVNFSVTDNPAGNLDEYSGGIRYTQAWLYNFRADNIVNPLERSAHRWNYAAGLGASAYVGGVYIDRSGNNPGQAHADVMIDANAMMSYDMRILHTHLLWRCQVSAPLVGLAFSPNYGQSYYEIFELKQRDHNVVFANVFNMPSIRTRISVDIPWRRGAVRIGMVAQINQSRLNNLKYNFTTIDMVAGYAKYLYRK